MDMLNMPTQKSVGHDSHAASINDFNAQMRAQPWYQDWFHSQGLDPNHVHLSQNQRQQLEQVILKNGGVPKDAFNDMMIDPAGNLNTEHGFASQPTWLKALEIGGAAAATGGLALNALGSSAVPTLASHAVTSGMAGAAPSLAGASTIGTAGLAGTSAALGGTGATLASLSGAPIVAGGTGASAAVPTIAGHAVTTGMAGAAPSLIGATTLANGVAPAGGGLINQLANRSTVDKLADAGKMLGNVGEAEANNRVNKADMTQGYDRLMIQSQQDRRANESDALKKLYQTSYIGSGGSQFKPPTISLGGEQRTAPDLGYGPKPASDAQKQGAATLQEQLLKRLQPTGSYTPQPLTGYSDRGNLEKLGSYGGLITSGLGLAKDIWGR